jgi:hypothetical protein
MEVRGTENLIAFVQFDSFANEMWDRKEVVDGILRTRQICVEDAAAK